MLAPDDADALFAAMRTAPAALFASPVYFYALPGQFKLFIDRSQKFWHCQKGESSGLRPAAVIMAAARKRGEKLFAGSLLTLKWFLKPFGLEIGRPLLLTGLETLPDVGQEELDAAHAAGFGLARMATAANR